jgi:hypothetical protein
MPCFQADFLEAGADVQHADVMAAFLQWDRNGVWAVNS